MPFATALTIVASLWATLPHADTAWGLLETAVPFVFTSRLDTGGVLTGTPDRVSVLASSWTQSSYRLGAIDVTDVTHGGTPLLVPDLSLMEGLEVHGASSALEDGRNRPTVTLAPLAVPTGSWLGSARASAAPSFLQSGGSRTPQPIARMDWLARGEATAGGHVGGRVNLVIAGAASTSRHQERGAAASLPGDLFSVFSRATIAAGVGRQGDIAGWLQQTRYPFAGRARLADRSTTVRDRFTGLTAAWIVGSVRIDGLLASTTSMPDAHAAPEPGTVERLVDGPVPIVAAPARAWHTRWSLGASGAQRLGDHHHLTESIVLSGASAQARPFGPRIIGETVGGIAARVWQYGYGELSERGATNVHVSVEDAIAARGMLSVDAGIRVDHVHGSARGSASAITWTSAEPRIALIAAPGAWRITASAQQYATMLPLDWLAVGDPGGPSGTTSLWNDTNRDGLVQPAEIGPPIAVVGPGGPAASIDPTLRRPRTNEFVLAVERRLGSTWAAGVMGVVRRDVNLPAVLNTGVPPSAYERVTIPDPGLDLLNPQDDQLLPIYRRPASTFGLDRYVLTSASIVGTSRGVQLYVMRDGPRWSVRASATAFRAQAPAAYRGAGVDENDPLVLGDAFSDPNSTTFAEGRPFFDRAYGLKLSGSVRPGHDVTVGTIARYADGQPFARLVLVPDLPQGPDVVRAYPNGLSRYTYTLTVDARVEKAFRWRSQRFAAGMDAFNLLDTQHEVEENPLTGARWRTPTAVQPPRVVRLTLRVEWN